MKKRILFLIGTLLPGICLLVPLLNGCSGEQKIPPVAVGEMEEYRDPVIGFRLLIPKGWIRNAEVGRARFYNAIDVDKKFLDPTADAPIGVEISVDANKTDDPAGRAKQTKDEMKASNFQLGPDQAVTIGGLPGTKVTYTGNYGNKNIVRGHHVWLVGDSIEYDLSFAGFGGNYEAYTAVFDSVLKTFQPGKPKEKAADPTLPAETMAEGTTALFTYQYPDNFNFINVPKGKNELVVELRGVRQDCSIRFDVFSTQGLTLEKVFDQNKGKYKALATGKATMGGQPALTLSYDPTPQVERRFYFAVKDNKVFRVTMDWFKPQREEYLAAYDKVINSFKFK